MITNVLIRFSSLLYPQLLILVDVFSQSIAPSKKMNGDPDLKLVPISDLERTKRGNMVIHAASHLQILVNRLNKIGLPLGK